jgi:hypothetical protein
MAMSTADSRINAAAVLIFEEDGEIHLFDLAEVKGKIVNAKVIQK